MENNFENRNESGQDQNSSDSTYHYNYRGSEDAPRDETPKETASSENGSSNRTDGDSQYGNAQYDGHQYGGGSQYDAGSQYGGYQYGSGSQYHPGSQQYGGDSQNTGFAQPGPDWQGYRRPSEPQPPKKKRGGLRVLGLIAIVVACVTLGVLLGTLVPTSTAQPGASLPSASSSQASAGPSSQPSAQATQKPSIGGNAPTITDYNNPMPDIYASVSKSVVSVQSAIAQNSGRQQITGTASGTGFVISEDGYILTNYHVVENSTEISITFEDGSEYEATLIGHDATLDVAVLKINATGLSVVAIGDSSAKQVGELIGVIGNPGSGNKTLNNSLTVGYISAVDRTVLFNNVNQNFIQIDAAINPGNSGGPLVDTEGKVIGIITLKSLVSSYDEYGNAISAEGLGFAIPINTAMDAVDQILTYGSVKKPGIGIYYRLLTEDEAAMLGVPQGILVSGFMGGSTAQAAGLQQNDIITACDGVQLTTMTELSEKIAGMSVGDTIQLTIVRQRKDMTITVTIGDMNEMTSAQ